ncbi:MAG: hypothetical protein ACRESZ_01625 [Methylococcales bacterium]
MYIRRTKTKTLDQGGGYYTYRIVESTRVEGRVLQRTLLNLGKDFPIAEEQWPLLCKRIEQLMEQPTHRQTELFPLSDELGQRLESAAQHYSVLILRKLSRRSEQGSDPATKKLEEPDYHTGQISIIWKLSSRVVQVLKHLSTLRLCNSVWEKNYSN